MCVYDVSFKRAESRRRLFSFSAQKREKSLIRFLEIRGRLGYNFCVFLGETFRRVSTQRDASKDDVFVERRR